MNWYIRPDGSITHLGNGTNVVYVNRKSGIVMVARWIANDKLDELITRAEAVR
jgi:hypothetical protein